MKRRTVLQGAAVAAGTALLGVNEAKAAPCCERDHDGDGNCDRHPKRVLLMLSLVLPGPYDKLAEQFQEGIEGFEEQWPDLEPMGHVHFYLRDKDGGPWLMSDAWEGEERTLQTERAIIFEKRCWDIPKRAVDTRTWAYWRQEVRPTMGLLSTKEVSRSLRSRTPWQKEQREQLGSVDVWFHGRVTPRFQGAGSLDMQPRLIAVTGFTRTS